MKPRTMAWWLFLMFWWAYPIFCVVDFLITYTKDSVAGIEKGINHRIKIHKEKEDV